LDGALREACCFGDYANACRHGSPADARGLTVEMQVNQIRGWLTIVPDNVAHENIEDVVVDRDRLAAPPHHERGDESGKQECRKRSSEFESQETRKTSELPVIFPAFLFS
jgi:hypothetical protein